jgi:predicted lipoprotein
MNLAQARQQADQTMAAHAASPSPQTWAAAQAAYHALTAAQDRAWADPTYWRGSPDTQPMR